VLDAQVVDQAADIGQVVGCIRGRQLQVKLFHGRHKEPLLLDILQIHLLDAGGAPRRLAHQGRRVDGGLDGYADDDILGQLGLAGQPVAFLPVLLIEMLREPPFDRSLLDDHAAFAAYPVTAAGGVDMHAGFHGGADHGLSGIHLDADIVWQKRYLDVTHSRSSHSIGTIH
jgi:hypothetical protein